MGVEREDSIIGEAISINFTTCHAKMEMGPMLSFKAYFGSLNPAMQNAKIASATGEDEIETASPQNPGFFRPSDIELDLEEMQLPPANKPQVTAPKCSLTVGREESKEGEPKITESDLGSELDRTSDKSGSGHHIKVSVGGWGKSLSPKPDPGRQQVEVEVKGESFLINYSLKEVVDLNIVA